MTRSRYGKSPYFQTPREADAEAYAEQIEERLAAQEIASRRGFRALHDGSIEQYEVWA